MLLEQNPAEPLLPLDDRGTNPPNAGEEPVPPDDAAAALLDTTGGVVLI